MEPMPDYPHIARYHEELRELAEFGGSDSELNIRPAFQNCLAAYCRDHRDRLVLVPELPASSGVVPDGAVKDALRMTRGWWEAKDARDDLDAEIQRKFNRGYPRDNIVFEDSRAAVLFQNGELAMRADMSRPGELHRLIRRFLDHELPEIEEFRSARQQFKTDLPNVLAGLRETIEEAEAESADYREAAAAFLDLCRRSIGPNVSEADVREMLLQHVLTKDIFLRVFGEDEFHRENNIAMRLDALERTFFTGDVRRNAIERLRAYYGAIGRAADEIAGHAEKQEFLKRLYEDFYKIYNPAAADRMGVVYTPNEIVDFIIRGADALSRNHFGRGLADDNVQILDPATGTGTFIASLINFLPADRLERKYRAEIHANELAILPYYIANLNIEYSYKERTGRYLEFPNLCFVDTLDNMDWQGATGEAVQRQAGFELGAISEENWLRVQEQNEKTISVIIGNPPYNDQQANWRDANPNRKYPAVDQRIKATYVAESTAQRTHQYDMYKRFIRWASDRLADDGIIAFITNRSYIGSRQDDGFRRVAPTEFSDIYLVDLGGDVRANGRVGNVFGIRTGVAIGFFVRRSKAEGKGRVRYYALPDEQSGPDKLAALKTLDVDRIPFAEIVPDEKDNWLGQSASRFGQLLPMANKETKLAKSPREEQALFRLYSVGIATNRDEWVYDFSPAILSEKMRFFSGVYQSELNRFSKEEPPINSLGEWVDKSIKWSRELEGHLARKDALVYSSEDIVPVLFRPFVSKFCYYARIATHMRYQQPRIYPHRTAPDNKVICFPGNAGGQGFYALAADRVVSHDLIKTTQCLPLYRYTAEGERVSNITQWGLRAFREHYGDDSITPEQVFAYAYAVLHDPVYLHDYKADLLREFPRLPFYKDFDVWERMGRELLDLHVGFESAEPYPLGREETGLEPGKPRLRADKERGVIVLDDATRLTGIPPEAWRYKLGARSALEWILDQYKERKPRDPAVAARFAPYRFADHKERVIDLLRRVCAVSAATMGVIDRMAYWDDDGRLIVWDDRDQDELAMLALSQLAEEGEDPEWEAAWSAT